MSNETSDTPRYERAVLPPDAPLYIRAFLADLHRLALAVWALSCLDATQRAPAIAWLERWLRDVNAMLQSGAGASEQPGAQGDAATRGEQPGAAAGAATGQAGSRQVDAAEDWRAWLAQGEGTA